MDKAQHLKSDLELISDVKKGSMRSLEALYDRYFDQIYAYIYQMLKRREIAQDLAQDVFLKVYRQAHQYQPTGKFTSWLYRMAKNMTLNYIRDNRATKTEAEIVSQSEDQINLIEQYVAGGESPQELAISQETQDLIMKGIEKLDPKDRNVIILCDVRGIPRKEAAEIIGCPVIHLNVHLHRARKRLAKLIGLKDELFEDES